MNERTTWYDVELPGRDDLHDPDPLDDEDDEDDDDGFNDAFVDDLNA